MAAPDPLAPFRLKQIRAARVSEISETTAAAPVPPEERVNFHIGNPLQDPQLSSAFLRIALGLPFERHDLHDGNLDALAETLGWEAGDRAGLEFLARTIQKSSPYMPRGGYSQKAPHALVRAFCSWLEKQQEPLQYDLGEQSGRREIILSSGGVAETLRVVFFALSDYLQVTPAQVLCYRRPLDLPESSFPNLRFSALADDERAACLQVEQLAALQPNRPTFLVIGGPLGEETRRKLRLLSLQTALFFIEANDAPNHLSLAREAKLVQRIIRLLTPAIFALHLGDQSTVFIAGNADFLKVIENVHFKMKGTPSASEVELLSFLLDRPGPAAPHQPAPANPDQPWLDGMGSAGSAETTLFNLTERAGARLAGLAESGARLAGRALAALDDKAALAARLADAHWHAGLYDEFAGLDTRQMLEQLVEHAHQPDWRAALERSFLCVFTKHQPQYRPDACRVASGSSRTALGIIGFHCGITDVVIPDLSWSYEQCFPNVYTVPLTETLELDVDGMIEQVRRLCQADPHWPDHGAVAINNPHNATGRIFDEAGIGRLIAYCLERGVYVIDDLSYQNVAPVPAFPEIKTARQVTNDLVRVGRLGEAATERMVSVHSMSKTDCLAGARLAVVEIREAALRERFQAINARVNQNLAAVFICYLFYRGPVQAARSYWRLRNTLFYERTQALLSALENLPAERNPFDLQILPPAGSMYPLLQVRGLPAGLSLDWLATSLARRGIGLLPLSTFARTEEGFDTGRRTFRLTLGGADHAPALLAKTRRLLIDLNRMIAEEQARYNRRRLPLRAPGPARPADRLARFDELAGRLRAQAEDPRLLASLAGLPLLDEHSLRQDFLGSYLPERLNVYRERFLDRAALSDEAVARARADSGGWLAARLEGEFMKDSLVRRQQLFRLRSYDRTVHPTQRYSLQAELAFDALLEPLQAGGRPVAALVETAAAELLQEYLGRSVSINSQREADEILLDFDALAAGEQYTRLFSSDPLTTLLSFWSDWDGSSRPSGQGHYLTARAVMENVRRMAR
ncbi:MAG: aminotransferase class I/II-fold pyridoxal phosphate-dependent enzyme, partial [Chloroflexota bacterium]